MKTLTLEIKDEKLLEKIVWMLSHFKKDGLKIREEDLEDSLKRSVEEMSLVNSGKLQGKPAQDLLNEL